MHVLAMRAIQLQARLRALKVHIVPSYHGEGARGSAMTPCKVRVKPISRETNFHETSTIFGFSPVVCVKWAFSTH